MHYAYYSRMNMIIVKQKTTELKKKKYLSYAELP